MNSDFDALGRILVIIPTFNELESLPVLVAALRQNLPTVNILVVDDNSPDGTGELANQLSASDSQIFVLHRTQKDGLGAAYLAGFAWAKENQFDVAVEMDADGSHRVADLPKLLTALTSADAVLGSRWVAGGEVVNWPISRKILSRGGNFYTRFMLGISLHDATGGFRAYRMATLDAINVQTVQSQGYCFQVDLAWRVVQKGLKAVEVPITFVERELGESKMDSKIVREALIKVTQWGIEKRRNQLLRLFRR